jgi:hypothetical protein
MNIGALNKNYDEWKDKVNNYIFKILRKKSEEINDIDYRYYYNNNYEPYIVSVLSVIQSQEFTNGLIYESFVVPFKDKTILVKVEK